MLALSVRSHRRSSHPRAQNRRVSTTLAALFCVCVGAAAGCSHTVTIKSDPPGADVTLDGEKVGKTPYSLDASSGFFDEHALKIEREGFSPFSTTIVQSEPIWPIVVPSVCLSPITLGGSCFGLCWGFRYAQAYEYELTPKVLRGDGGLDEGTVEEDLSEADLGQAIPY